MVEVPEELDEVVVVELVTDRLELADPESVVLVADPEVPDVTEVLDDPDPAAPEEAAVDARPLEL